MKQAEDNIIVNVYDPLFYLDNDNNIVCALAESYVENEDGTVDVTLRSGVKFHSGDTLDGRRTWPTPSQPLRRLAPVRCPWSAPWRSPSRTTRT